MGAVSFIKLESNSFILPHMFIYLFFALLPALSAADCVYPGYPDGVDRDPRGFLSYYQTNSTLSAYCLTSCCLSGIVPNKECQQDGTWKGVFTRCANDVGRRLVWKSANGTCSYYELLCKPATFWELSLEVVSYPNIEGFKLYTTNQDEPTDMTVELVSLTGETKQMTISGAKNGAQGELSLSRVARVKISSIIPISMWDFDIYSFSGYPLYNISARYWKTYNEFSRIVISEVHYDQNFTEAHKKCVSFGGRLVETPTPETLGYLENEMYLPKVWIGLSASNNIWKWESGKSFDQDLFVKYQITGDPSNGMAIYFDPVLKKLVSADKNEKLSFACKLDSIAQGCMNPGIPAAGRILRTNNGRTVYECFKGYRMVGEAVRRCNLTTGYYETEIPQCLTES